MALTDLLRSLDEDAARELDQVQAEQQHEADAVRAAAEEQAAATVAEAREKARAEAERSAQVRLAEARAQARGRRDQALHAELDALSDAARSRLADEVGTDAGRRATRALLGEALDLLPSARRVRIEAGHRGVVEDLNLHVVEESVGIGVIVEDEFGRAVDNTAAVRLRNVWPRERGKFARTWLDQTRSNTETPASP